MFSGLCSFAAMRSLPSVSKGPRLQMPRGLPRGRLLLQAQVSVVQLGAVCQWPPLVRLLR